MMRDRDASQPPNHHPLTRCGYLLRVMTLDLVTVGLLFGVACLGASLVPVFRLLRITRAPHLRRAWLWLAAIIAGFVAGYLALIGLLPRDSDRGFVSLVSAVLVMGGVFVLSVSLLALGTAADAARLARLEREVIVDPLTGVYNRRFLDDQLPREIALAARSRADLSLLVADIDLFKTVNDTHGHAVGDHVLAVAAARLGAGVRDTDILVRYGGEEFVVIAPGTDAATAGLLAERLCARIALSPVRCPGGATVPITVSIGAATLRAGETAGDIFRRADAALYAAKRAGRNCAVLGDACAPEGPRSNVA